MSLPTTIDDVVSEFEAMEDFGPKEAYDERMIFVRKLGEALEAMPDALKTDSTLVRGCAAKVWVYPVPTSNSERLHFLADSDAAITKGIIALVLMTVENKSAEQVVATNIEEILKPLNLQAHFSSLRTSGLANMIIKIRETAERLAA